MQSDGDRESGQPARGAPPAPGLSAAQGPFARRLRSKLNPSVSAGRHVPKYRIGRPFARRVRGRRVRRHRPAPTGHPKQRSIGSVRKDSCRLRIRTARSDAQGPTKRATRPRRDLFTRHYPSPQSEASAPTARSGLRGYGTARFHLRSVDQAAAIRSSPAALSHSVDHAQPGRYRGSPLWCERRSPPSTS